MGILDFMDGLGEQANKFKKVKIDSYLQQRIPFMEILVNRGVMGEDFKSELIEKYISEKWTKEILDSNIEKSINLYESIKLKLVSVDDEIFNLKNDVQEYIGEIDKLPNDPSVFNPNSGKMSYNFAIALFEHLKNKELSLKEVNYLSDALDVKIQSVFNNSRIPSHLFSAVIFQSVVICIHDRANSAVLVYIFFWWAIACIATILCNKQYIM